MSAVSVSEITAPFRPLCDYSSLSPYALSAITLPEYKKLDFVLEMPENGGPEGQKRTKTSILCSKCPKTGAPKAESAQKCRFCAREEGDSHQGERKLASGSITMAFPQITAHALKMQTSHNLIINFYQRAR